jgi:hypothetical protein
MQNVDGLKRQLQQVISDLASQDHKKTADDLIPMQNLNDHLHKLLPLLENLRSAIKESLSFATQVDEAIQMELAKDNKQITAPSPIIEIVDPSKQPQGNPPTVGSENIALGSAATATTEEFAAPVKGVSDSIVEEPSHKRRRVSLPPSQSSYANEADIQQANLEAIEIPEQALAEGTQKLSAEITEPPHRIQGAAPSPQSQQTSLSAQQSTETTTAESQDNPPKSSASNEQSSPSTTQPGSDTRYSSSDEMCSIKPASHGSRPISNTPIVNVESFKQTIGDELIVPSNFESALKLKDKILDLSKSEEVNLEEKFQSLSTKVANSPKLFRGYLESLLQATKNVLLESKATINNYLYDFFHNQRGEPKIPTPIGHDTFLLPLKKPSLIVPEIRGDIFQLPSRIGPKIDRSLKPGITVGAD